MAIAVIYCRTASGTSSEITEQLAKQESACRKLAERLGYEVVATFQDHASGNGSDRPGLRDMLSFLESGTAPLAAVLVKDHARIAREPAQYLQIADAVQAASGTIVSASDDPSEPA